MVLLPLRHRRAYPFRGMKVDRLAISSLSALLHVLLCFIIGIFDKLSTASLLSRGTMLGVISKYHDYVWSQCSSTCFQSPLTFPVALKI